MSSKKQNRLIFLCWLIYACAYIGRYSYNSNITHIMEYYGTTRAQAGLVTSCFFFAYGIGQILNGFFCKYYSKKYVLSAALLISAATNVAVFCGVPFALLKYLWLLNGIAQSTLWTSLMLILAENLASTNLQKAVMVMGSTIAAGTVMAYGASALFSEVGDFKWTFLLGGAVLLFLSFLWLLWYPRLSEAPDRIPFHHKSEQTTKTDTVQEGKKKVATSAWIMVAALAVISIVTNLIKDGLTTWVPAILKENYNLTDSLSIFLTLFLPIISIFATTLNVLLYKKIPDFVMQSGAWFVVAAIMVGCVIGLLHTPYWFLILICFVVTSLCMYGVNNVTTNMGPLYMRDTFNTAKLAGVLNGFCYVGSTISSYALGLLADHKGWNSIFYLFQVCTLIPLLICAIILIASRKKRSSD